MPRPIPAKINMASPGSAARPMSTTDLLSGQVQLYFGTTASSLEYVRTGKLRALGVTIERRLDALPEIPTVAKFVPGYEASNWYGVGAPKAVVRRAKGFRVPGHLDGARRNRPRI